MKEPKKLGQVSKVTIFGGSLIEKTNGRVFLDNISRCAHSEKEYGP